MAGAAAGDRDVSGSDLLDVVLSGLRRADGPATGRAAVPTLPPPVSTMGSVKPGWSAPSPGRAGDKQHWEDKQSWEAVQQALVQALDESANLPDGTPGRLQMRNRIFDALQAGAETLRALETPSEEGRRRWWHRFLPWRRRTPNDGASETPALSPGDPFAGRQQKPPTPRPLDDTQDLEDIVSRTNRAGLLHPSQPGDALPARPEAPSVRPMETRPAVERGTPVSGVGWLYGRSDGGEIETTTDAASAMPVVPSFLPEPRFRPPEGRVLRARPSRSDDSDA